MFANLEAHFAKWAEQVGSEVAQHARHFLDSAKQEEEKLAAEIDHLKSLGLQVLKDGALL